VCESCETGMLGVSPQEATRLVSLPLPEVDSALSA
jgi:hypothetical protein